MKSFDYQQHIDDTQKETEKVKSVFFAIWNQQIRDHFPVRKNFRIEDYVDVYGGFFLGKEEFEHIDASLKTFYLRRIETGRDKVFLRGYDYYYVDPLVHLNSNKKNPSDMLKLFQNKWESYRNDYEFSFLNNDIIYFENWIAAIGFLEYIMNDISSLQWFIYWEKKSWDKDTENILSRLSEGAELIGKSIALLLSFQYKSTYHLLHENLKSILKNGISAILHISKMGTKDWTAVRAIREGDSISLIYGAYIMKLAKFFREKYIKGILLSNSFGAMNTGIVLKYLLLEQKGIKIDSLNVLYMQNRAEEDCIYESSVHQECNILGKWTGEKYQAAIIVDDSIFTGKSFLRLKEYVKKINMCADIIYSLPMTINCDCLRYCRRGISSNENIEVIVKRVVKYSHKFGDCLPPFTSFWDFSRDAPENNIETENDEVRKVLKGDDGLMKHIWARFEMNILKHDRFVAFNKNL